MKKLFAKAGNNDQARLISATGDHDDDVGLLTIEPGTSAQAPCPPSYPPPYAQLSMQPASSGMMQPTPTVVCVTTPPVAYGGGSVYVVSQPIKPNPHCCLSIFAFILCPPLGLIAWLCSCCVKCDNDRNDLKSAQFRSSCACGWATTAIILGLLSAIAVTVMAIGGFWVFANACAVNGSNNLDHAVGDVMHNMNDGAQKMAQGMGQMLNVDVKTNKMERAGDKIADFFHKVCDNAANAKP